MLIPGGVFNFYYRSKYKKERNLTCIIISDDLGIKISDNKLYKNSINYYKIHRSKQLLVLNFRF